MKGVKDALSRLEGAKTITVKLQDGLILVETDPAKRVLPSAYWKEIIRVGFAPAAMEAWATGILDAHAFELDGGKWSLVKPTPGHEGKRRVHFKIASGGEDPPRVEFVE